MPRSTRFVLVILAACGSGSSSGRGSGGSSGGDGGPSGIVVHANGCMGPTSGTYLLELYEMVTNCGQVDARLIDFTGKGEAAICPGGSGTITFTPASGGECEAKADLTGCEIMTAAGTFTEDLSLDGAWRTDDSSSSGEVTLTVTSPTNCMGNYAFVLSKR